MKLGLHLSRWNWDADPATLESTIEEGIERLLGFHSTTIVRSQPEIEAIIPVVVGTRAADDVAWPKTALFGGETVGILADRTVVKISVGIAVQQYVVRRPAAIGCPD